MTFLLTFLTRLLTGVVPQSHGFRFDPEVQRIYYANHTSHLDTVLIWSLIPPSQRKRVRPAAAKDYWWTSPWRRFIAEGIFHAVPLVRQREGFHNDPLEALAEALAKGDSLILFPEGTRAIDGKIHPFKPGLYHLAHRFPDVEFVPVYIENLNRVLPKGEFFPIPILCAVHFGSGFKISQEETRSGFLDRARHSLEALAS